jgi:hypothetical protein
MFRILPVLFVVQLLIADDSAERQRRLREVQRIRGFAALWDFVKRAPDGRFDAYKAKNVTQDLRLDAINYVRGFWKTGRAATYDDFPLLGRGPFGQAIRIRNETDRDFRPLLMVPRTRLHDSPIDVKGPGRSVSMVVWVIRESGSHALAGIWHEGTDLPGNGPAVQQVERGKRQYALFAGLAANPGASAAHVSENGAKSFGDRYARNLSVTPEKIPEAPDRSPAEVLDAAWTVVAMSFDNQRNTVTSYINGAATSFWIEAPAEHPFYQWPARGWLQAQLHRIPGAQEGEDLSFPRDQFYEPPERKPRKRKLLSENGSQRVELHEFEFTKVRVTLRKNARGQFAPFQRDLAALRANPFWFAHDLYSPGTPQDGGPFTIGRVIHTSRSIGTTGYIGGVAVFDRALSRSEMERIARIRKPIRAGR